MKFSSPLIEGRLIKRYKRFFADIELEGEVVTAHVPNTGSLNGCLEPGSPCLVTKNDDPARKLKYTLQMIRTPQSWVGVNTGLANDLVWEAFQNQIIPHWIGFDAGQREVKISAESRVDLVLWPSSAVWPTSRKLKFADLSQGTFHFVEVKNVTLARGTCAQFPDAETIRGQKHLDELVALKKIGHSAETFFLVQREDTVEFTPAADIDPVYAEKLKAAQLAGVTVSAWSCELSPSGITIKRPIPALIQRK